MRKEVNDTKMISAIDDISMEVKLSVIFIIILMAFVRIRQEYEYGLLIINTLIRIIKMIIIVFVSI